jgi:hypothetical protein
LGPYTVAGSGTIFGSGAEARGAVLDGSVLEPYSSCAGAYLGRGAVLRARASVFEGAVIGSGAVVGSGAVILEGSRVWPRKEIPSGMRVAGSVTEGSVRRLSAFDDSGVIRGLPHVDVTPDFCCKLGAAAAAQTGRGEVSIAWRGGEAARLASLALETGVCAGGGQAVLTDASSPSCAAFAGKQYNIPLNVFIKQDGRELELYFYDSGGLTPGRADERKLEAATLRGDITLAGPDSLRPPRRLRGLNEQYAEAAGSSDTEGAVFHNDGLSLSAELCGGRELETAHLLGIMIQLEAARGADKLALPADAPAFLDDTAARLGVTALRVERDGEEARELLSRQPYMRDPAFMAARLAQGCRKFNTTLAVLAERLPSFRLTAGEVAVESERGAVMRELARALPGAELDEGIRARARGGWIRVAPAPNRRALRIIAEGLSTELAAELYADFARKVRELDRDTK